MVDWKHLWHIDRRASEERLVTLATQILRLTRLLVEMKALQLL